MEEKCVRFFLAGFFVGAAMAGVVFALVRRRI